MSKKAQTPRRRGARVGLKAARSEAESVATTQELAEKPRAATPWRNLGEARCGCCGARYRVAEAPLSERITGWFRCRVCDATVASWAAPAARAYTLI